MRREPRNDSLKAILFISIYICLVSSPLIIAVLLTPDTHHGFLTELGKGFSMIGFWILTLQFLLTSRIPLIEQPFGLDMIYSFHKRMAIFAFILLIIHPFLIMAGENKWELLLTMGTWNIIMGKIAMVLLLIQIISSAFRKVLHISFERWRYMHKLSYPLFVLIFIHSLFSGGDFEEREVMKIIWLTALIIVMVVLIYNSYLKPRRLTRNIYQVKEVIEETLNTWTLTLSPEKGEIFQYLPGQFLFLTLIQDRFPLEEHPFSISSSPLETDSLSVTIKGVGDYTQNIRYIKRGARAIVDGPYGRFSCLFHDYAELVFIAGGIGITPIISMLRYLRGTGERVDITLFYSNKNDDFIFRKELEEMYPFIKVVFIVSQPLDTWKGEIGRLDQEKIMKYIEKDIDKKGFYICGPASMMNTVVYILSELEVPRGHIYFENFTL